MTTQPSSLAHYAMWPPKLAERLVLSMCPQWVCATCGEPRRRVEGKTPEYAAFRAAMSAGENKVTAWDAAVGNRAHGFTSAGTDRPHRGPKYDTLGWTDCGHDNYRPGTVLDPFAGTGTTLAVAHLHGRDAIGIDIDERNRDMYPARLDECRRALFGTKPEMPGQVSLFGEAT